jgi:HK97 family phage prohead protease
MSTILYRSADLTPGTGRTVHGIAVPYGQVAEVSDGDGRAYLERFEFGACARTIRERGSKVKLLAQHDHRRFPIGKATSLVERSDGLHGEFAIPATAEGDDVLTLIRDGVLDSFSVGFRGIRERWDGDVRVRTEVALIEVSLVGLPAYEGALVGGVRSPQPLVIPRAVAQARRSLMDW